MNFYKNIDKNNKNFIIGKASRRPATVSNNEIIRIILLFQIRAFYQTTTKPQIYFEEVVRQFITENGKHEFVGKMLSSLFNYQTAVSWGGNFEIRDNKSFNKFNVYPDKIYPKIKVLPKVIRNGYKGTFHDLTPLDFITNILSDNKAETLLKSNQIDLFRKSCVGYTNSIQKYWNTLKICLRKNYIIKDPSIYFDYLCNLTLTSYTQN